MSTEQIKTEGLFYTVIDGTFRRRVPEGTPGSIKREYETKDGAKAIKHEMLVDGVEGVIEDITLRDGDFGRTINIRLDANEKGINPNLQFSVENTYGEDVLKKLPRVDFSQPVKFRPYAFTDNNGKEVRGVELRQNDEKLFNYFWDDTNKKSLHGMPELDGDPDTFTKDDWKIFFMQRRKFLVEYFEKNIAPKFVIRSNSPSTVSDAHSIDPGDIPF